MQEHPAITLTPPAVLRIDLRQPMSTQSGLDRKQKMSSGVKVENSWWIVRATADEITPGFNREEIIRTMKVDSVGTEALFAQVTDLLSELSVGSTIV